MMVEQGEECCVVPPGFRFHPTEEELVGYYLARKVARSSTTSSHDLDIIQEVDLYRIEPWDLQGRCKPSLGGGAGHDDGHTTASEWYFFSYKDRKYPSGTRTNRATAAGFWKATGRDKPVLSRSASRVIGMRKTLVFYKGRAPNGRKTDWIMHEYRLQPAQEEGWVVCRAFQKPIPNQRPFVFPTYYATPAGYCYDHLPSINHLQVGGGPALHAPLAAGNSFFPPQQLCSDDDDLLESKKHSNLFSSCTLPPLESPTACAQQRAAAYVVASENDDELMIQGGGGHAAAAAAGAIDWNFLDTLLSTTTTTTQLLDPSTLLQ